MDRFNLSKWAIEHPALVGFLIVLLSAMGGVEFARLGRAEDPSFTLKEMIVAASWPGASPAKMQSQIADPIEKALRSVESLESVSTYCIDGACITQVALQDNTPKERVPVIWQSVRNKVHDISPDMPAGSALTAYDDYSDVYGYIFMLTGAENARLVRSAEMIREQFLRLPGAGKVKIDGEIPQKVFVEFDPHRLAGMGIGAGELARALAKQAAVEPIGINQFDVAVPVHVDGQPDGVAGIENSQVPTPDGPVRIGDIAKVSRGYADPPSSLVRSEGRNAVAISVAMASGADGLAFGDALHATAARLGTKLPAGVKLVQVEDQSANIREAVNTFLIKFFVALTVVLIIAFVTLGFRTGIVVALSVPLTLAITALFMGAAGIDLERISLGALILSLGLLVDDAIISVEAMVVQLEQGASRNEAAAFAWRHTAFPMLTGTLLTVAGFLPVGFAQSTTSEYTSDLFWVTGTALIVSWIVAVVFTPYLGIKLLPDKHMQTSHEEIYATPVYRCLRGLVKQCLTHRGPVVAATAALFIASVAGSFFVQQQFFPLSDRPELIVGISMRPGSTIAATSHTVAQIERRLAGDNDVARLSSFIGDGGPRFYLTNSPALPDNSKATIILVAKDLDSRERLIEKIRHLPLASNASLDVNRLSLGPSAGFPVQYRVVGSDPARLREIADRVARVFQTTPDVTSVQVDWGKTTPVMRLVPDPARLAALGGNRSSLSNQVQGLINGTPSGDILSDNKRIGVIVRADAADRTDAGRLGDLPVETEHGFIPVRQLAQITVDSQYPLMWRRNGSLIMTVGSNMKNGVQASEIVERVTDRIDAIRKTLPRGYRIETGGDEELSDKANNAIYAMLPLTFAVMLILLMAQLQSISRTLLVLATAPLGLIGAVTALLVTGQPLGFVAMLGLIAVAGMIMRNSIILVDQVRRNQQDGMSLHEAIMEATISRSRPVVLTALAAILAFVPLCFNIFWGPMAVVLIGGMAGATVLTLLALPALCALVLDRAPRSTKESIHA